MDPSPFNVLCIKALLRYFELVLGLKVNFRESCLANVGVEESCISRYPRWLNYCVMDIPFVYLGIFIGVNLRNEMAWVPIIKKLCSKLAR